MIFGSIATTVTTAMSGMPCCLEGTTWSGARSDLEQRFIIKDSNVAVKAISSLEKV
jgi:hypothetical protein